VSGPASCIKTAMVYARCFPRNGNAPLVVIPASGSQVCEELATVRWIFQKTRVKPVDQCWGRWQKTMAGSGSGVHWNNSNDLFLSQNLKNGQESSYSPFASRINIFTRLKCRHLGCNWDFTSTAKFREIALMLQISEVQQHPCLKKHAVNFSFLRLTF